jgi:peptidase M13-like protein
VDPCTDFYQFACGGWLAANPVPGDRARWGSFDELQERNDQRLRRVLETASTGVDPAAKKIGDYYASCMDEDAIERRGITPLDPDLKNIAALTAVSRLPDLLAELHKIGVNAFFSFGSELDMKNASMVIAGADQGGMGLPDRDYYFREDARSVDIRKQYVAHVTTLLTLGGTPAARAAAEADAVMRVETALGKDALDRLSGPVARLQRAVDRTRRSGREFASREYLRSPSTAEQDRQARGHGRMEHDGADGQCVLQRAPEQHQLPRRHSSAAVLRGGARRCAQLRRRRPLSRERHVVQHAGVSASVLVQVRCADGQSAGMSRHIQ